MAPEKTHQMLSAREEAVPRLFERLTAAQKDAYRAINARIAGIANEEWTPQAEPDADQFLPTIDETRTSRVVLIDGERGSGKTSLLVTMLRSWSRPFRSDVTGEPDKDDGKEIQQPPGVVPVCVVELAPLPDSTNMLFLLVSSLRPVMREVERRRFGTLVANDASDRRGPWQRPEAGELDSRRSWRAFVRTAAVGWSRDLPQRQPQLDAESFALELEQAEDHRLQVMTDFRAFVSDLVRDFRECRPASFPDRMYPLLVIPIDDADMDAQKAFQVLETIRILHHPRVVYLLTGSSELFLDTLRGAVASKLVTPLRNAYGDGDPVRQVQRRSLELAQRIYQKSIPVAHQFTLQALEPHERFENLESLLQEVECNTDSKPALPSLADYMRVEPTFQRALPSWMRELVDLRATVTSIVERPKLSAPSHRNHPRPIVSVVDALWRAALEDAQVQPNPDEALDAWSAVRVTEVERRLEVVESVVSITGSQRQLFAQTEGMIEGRHLRCRVVEDWYGIVNNLRLTSRASAMFLLASTLALESHEDALIGRDQQWRNPGFRFAEVSFSDPGLEKTFELGWPLFDSRMLLDVMMFARAWKTLGEKTLTADLDADAVARRFVQLGLWVTSTRPPKAEAVPQTDRPPTWGALAKDLKKLYDELDGVRESVASRSLHIRRWIVERVGLFATPECGLASTHAAQVIKAFHDAFGTLWHTRLVPAVRQSRTQRMQFTLDLQDNTDKRSRTLKAPRVLELLDATMPQHPWVKLTKTRTRVTRTRASKRLRS